MQTRETEYRIMIEQDGGTRVKVAKMTAPLTCQMVWMFTLDGKDEPVVLQDFYTPERFLIMDWNGHLRAYDVGTMKKVFERDFKAGLDCRAVISPDRTKLYVSHNPDYRHPTLTVLSLDDFSVLAEHPLPKPIDLEFVKLRADGQLLYYYLEWHWDSEETREKNWTHGYQVVDPATGRSKQFLLPHAPTTQFDKKAPVLDLKRNLGAMADWSPVEVKRGDDGEPLFVMKMTLFELEEFRAIWTIPVRDFRTEHLTCWEKTDQQVANALAVGPGGKEYDKAREGLLENLNSIRFSKHEDALWLCWRAGVLRKVALDCSKMSPLLVTAKMPRHIDAGPFEHRFFHSHLGEIREESLLLSEHHEPLMISLDGIDLDSPEDFIPVEVQPVPEEDKIKVITPRGFKTQMEEMGKVVIRVANLNEDASILEALDELVERTKDIGAIRDGWKLLFLVRDKKGKKWGDEKFFQAAARVEGAGERISRIIENFVAYPGAEELYIHEEATALCYAAESLGLSDPKWLDTVFSYLSVIDFEHDVYCREALIPNLIGKYSGTKHEPRVRIGIAMTDDYDGAELYMLQEFKNPHSPFRKWFEAGGAAEIPKIVEEMYGMGLRERFFFERGIEGLERLQAAFEGDFLPEAEKAEAGMDPGLLGWNYLKHIENPKAGQELAGNDMSEYEEDYLRLLAFAGLANMLTFDILPDDVHITVQGVEDPRVKELLPDPVVFSQIGGLMHRVEGETFLRLPGLMMFEGMEFVIDYLTSTRIEPDEVEALRRESWNMDPADLLMNLPVLFADRLEDILFFMQPPFHSTERKPWSDWLVRMKLEHVLQGLTAGMVKQLFSFATKLSRMQPKVDFLVDHEVRGFLEAVKNAMNKKKGEPDTPPEFDGFVRV
ncbi:MAG: hypothetical protein ACLFTB_00595 [Desulfovibrionales bacterium]